MNSNQQKDNCVSSNDDICETNEKKEGNVDTNEVEQVQNEAAKFKFAETHPGHDFSHLRRRKFEFIPVMNIQKGSLCSIKELNLNSDDLTKEVSAKRESYAKIALLMFCPCREKEDLMIEDSYWKNSTAKGLNEKKKKTVFLTEGFDVLQHINDRLTLSSQARRARDPVTLRKPLQDLELPGDVNYEYSVEKQELKEEEHNLPDLWR